MMSCYIISVYDRDPYMGGATTWPDFDSIEVEADSLEDAIDVAMDEVEIALGGPEEDCPGERPYVVVQGPDGARHKRAIDVDAMMGGE